MSIPSFAVEKCRDLVCDMAQIARKSINDATKLLSQYDSAVVKEVEKNEALVDTYEDKISTYLVKIASTNLSADDSKIVTELLHCIGDIERISDHAVNITEALTEIKEKDLAFSSAAKSDLRVISSAVNEVLTLATDALYTGNLEIAKSVEPLEQVIDRLKLKIKANHIVRLQNGICSMEMGFILSDLLTNFERVADHCSNIAVCLIEIAHGSFETHEYLNHLKNSGEYSYVSLYNTYKKKYVL